jgi:integrase-like protein
MADLAWGTRVTYKGDIKRTILPTLGHLPLRRIDTATLDRFYSKLECPAPRHRHPPRHSHSSFERLSGTTPAPATCRARSG